VVAVPAASAARLGPTTEGSASGPTYLVRSGDTLWSIADQAYGSGTSYRRLIEANLGLRMPDGHVFDARGVIQPGWRLVIPDAATAEVVDGERWYTVQHGDTLSAIAAALCGDEAQWADLFALNQGALSPDGTRTLTDPNVIWPGLRLRLAAIEPDAVAQSPNPDVSLDDDLVAASTVTSAPPVEVAELAPLVGAAAPDALATAPVTLDDDVVIGEPLLRTRHALDPIALDPADVAVNSPDAGSRTADTEGNVPAAPRPGELPIVPLAAGGAGLLAAAGAAALTSRRLRPLPQERETEVVVEGGFAAAQLTPTYDQGAPDLDVDPLTIVVSRLVHFLEEYQLQTVHVVAVQHGRSATTFTLTASLAEQALIVDLAPVIAAELDAEVDASVSADQDVMLRVAHPRKRRLLPLSGGLPTTMPRLLPLGVLYDRQSFAAAWEHLGHVLIASLPGHGADAILTSVVAALTARHSPTHLHVWLMARARALPRPLFDLPHVQCIIDPDDETAVADAIERLRVELDTRADADKADADLIVVIPELATLGAAAADFELLAPRAAGLGVRFIVATASPADVLETPLIPQFGTRLVLRMQDEETSMALLGVADAAFLGGGGRLLLRLDNRAPVELYGYQVAPEHLERLVRVMRSAYAAPPPPEPPTSSSDSASSTPNAVDAPGSAEQPATDDDTATAAEPTADRPSTPDALSPSQPAEAAVQSLGGGPPIIVNCFGGPRIFCLGQQIWPRLGAGDVKPFEFLLYLACQPAEGVTSDEAVEALWPESDAENAAHRFRQLRYRLRHALATVLDAPRTDGIVLDRRGTLKLDPAVVRSDAAEFLGLVRNARVMSGSEAMAHLERARELYVGDLLEGPDARRYAWLDERDVSGVTLREHFRRQFQVASTRLAELYAQAGESAAAVEVYRELTAIDPGDERLWRALFRLHAERGDRLALMRDEHALRLALRDLSDRDGEGEGPGKRDDFVDEPSRDLLDEYQRLLDGLHDADREIIRV
ncbi:MAG TPA: LysM peptidoglycan-binding domain-containing protein, partial [Chloroflexota bacterium]|nr:LysM peptidoglycan-binding domain-containing protein [Chloroflexota bacterium]